MAKKNEKFTENLKAVIASSGLGNTGFAKRAGLGYSTLMTYLNDNNYGHVAEWEQLLKISSAAGKSINWLLTGGEDNRPSCEVGCDYKIKELCQKVKEVIESDTSYSGALESNINSFHEAVEEKMVVKELTENVRKLTIEVNNIKKTHSDGHASDTQEEPAESTG